MALDTIVMVSALNCAHFVLNATSLQLIPAKVRFSPNPWLDLATMSLNGLEKDGVNAFLNRWSSHKKCVECRARLLCLLS